MGRHVATCRYCGAQGIEDDEIDPMPGVCPDCMERLLDRRLAELEASLEMAGMEGAETDD